MTNQATSKTTPRRTIFTWLIGVVVGTLIIAATSPLFVRTYVPLRLDEVRGVWRLSQTTAYRWRSEGYANTAIGPLGMPGRTELPRDDDTTLKIALWGDSQAEGCAVADADKIFAQTEQLASATSLRISVLPFARSGESAADWISQFSRVDEHLRIDAHVLLIAELVDLPPASDPSPLPGDDLDLPTNKFAVADHFPAFAIQAARNLFTNGEDSSLRTLRFSVGRINAITVPAVVNQSTNATARGDTTRRDTAHVDWKPPIDAIVRSTNRPIVLVYAPVVPNIFDGQVVSQDADQIEFERLKQVATENGITVVDLRDAFLDAANRGAWPHGFHNGHVGSGHLNATGNRIVADGILRGIQQLQLRSDKGVR